MSGHYGLIELVLVFGAVLGFAVWELRKTNRDIKKNRDIKTDQEVKADRRSRSDERAAPPS